MKTKFQKYVVLAAALTGLSLPSAWAGVGVDIVGAATYSMPTGLPVPTGAFAYPGGGLILNVGSNMFQFSVGALYLPRSLTINGVNDSSSMIDGMLGFKFLPARWFFIELGGYYNYLLSSTSGWIGSNYGAYGGLGFKIPLSQKVAILIDGQYRYALSGLVSLNGAITPNEIVGMVGLSIGNFSTK